MAGCYWKKAEEGFMAEMSIMLELFYMHENLVSFLYYTVGA